MLWFPWIAVPWSVHTNVYPCWAWGRRFCRMCVGRLLSQGGGAGRGGLSPQDGITGNVCGRLSCVTEGGGAANVSHGEGKVELDELGVLWVLLGDEES